jgi:hypothetical protein
MASDADALPVPDDLRDLLERHATIDWGRIAWDAVRARAAQVDRAEALARQSRLKRAQAKQFAALLRGEA